MNGAPSQLDLWDYKPQLAGALRQGPARQRPQRASASPTMTSGQARFPVAPSHVQVRAARQVRHVGQRAAAAHREDRRRHRAHQDGPHQRHQPRPGLHLRHDRQRGARQAEHRLVARLRPRQREQRPAGVRRPHAALARRQPTAQALFTRMWAAASCPTKHSGVALRAVGDPVLYLQNPAGRRSATDRRTMLDALGKLNQQTFERFGDPETQTRIAQYEMAFRMQTQRAGPDRSQRARRKATLDLYGPDVQQARHLRRTARCSPGACVERGVRVVQILHRGWDQHGNLPNDISRASARTPTRPRAALRHGPEAARPARRHARRLGRRVRPHGLLAGHADRRTNYGRDHHPRNFCMWLAGGGIKGGIVYGETDDFSYNIVEGPRPPERPERHDPALPGHRPRAVHASSSRASTSGSPASRRCR